MPRGTTRIDVRYDYDKLETGAGVSFNIIDIGIFDASGKDLGDAAGFRGWSGGARDSFSISRTRATPGYLPGPITAGTWHVVLGPFTVVPPGVEWSVTVTLHRGPGPALPPQPAPRRVPRHRPGLVPRRPAHPHRALRRPPHPAQPAGAGRARPGSTSSPPPSTTPPPRT